MNWTPEKLVEFKTINDEGLDVLKKLVEKRRNILIIGASGAGKSVLTRVMLNMIDEPLRIAFVRATSVEYQEVKHDKKFFSSIDEFINEQDEFDLVVIDNNYTMDFVQLKRIKIPKIVLIQDKKIEYRLSYLARNLIDAVIKMVMRVKKYALIDPIFSDTIRTVDTIKLFDKHLGTYVPVYRWNDEGGHVDYQTFNRIIGWEPKLEITKK